MRRTVRAHSTVSGPGLLADAIARSPEPLVAGLHELAERTDLPLTSGSWVDDDGGCLVAGVVALLEQRGERPEHPAGTLDLRLLGLVPEMSGRDLNRIVVAWDEAAALLPAGDRADDAALRGLLREALRRAEQDLAARQGAGW